MFALPQNDYAAARAHLEESLTMRRELGDRVGIANSLSNLGNAALEQGDYAAARTLYEESLAINREIDRKLDVVFLLEGFASLALAQTDRMRSAQLHGAADAWREAMNSPALPIQQAKIDAQQATLRDALSEDAFAAAWQTGRAMTLEEAAAYALEEGDPKPDAS
jgi:tetratricopeptide (TPR) repeat protein